jgi:hypothetical protein
MANSHLIVSEFCRGQKQMDFADQFREIPQDPEQGNSKMLLFPLNSEYLKR